MDPLRNILAEYIPVGDIVDTVLQPYIDLQDLARHVIESGQPIDHWLWDHIYSTRFPVAYTSIGYNSRKASDYIDTFDEPDLTTVLIMLRIIKLKDIEFDDNFGGYNIPLLLHLYAPDLTTFYREHEQELWRNSKYTALLYILQQNSLIIPTDCQPILAQLGLGVVNHHMPEIEADTFTTLLMYLIEYYTSEYYRPLDIPIREIYIGMAGDSMTLLAYMIKDLPTMALHYLTTNPDINLLMRDAQGNTYAHLALIYNQKDILRLLLTMEPKLYSIRNNGGLTVRGIMYERNEHFG